MCKILRGFVDDPPDTEFQEGFLAGMLVFANEVLGIRFDDPLWQEADAILKKGAGEHSVAEAVEAVRKFTVIDGDKT